MVRLPPPAVTVHGAEMARLAVAAASAARLGVTLLSAPGAGAYGGVGWWRSVVTLAGAQAGQDILDCGWSVGRALEALRAGQGLLVLRAERRVWTNIAERAANCGASVMERPPPSLDLAKPGALRLLANWLGAPVDRSSPD